MSNDIRHMPIYRPEAHFDAFAAPTYQLSEIILSGISKLYQVTAASFQSWKRGRAIAITISELSRLGGDQLRDIGVDRDNIYAAAVAVVDDPKADIRGFASR
jgi:uncharacterized protein YjiS (DUF1127 family)